MIIRADSCSPFAIAQNLLPDIPLLFFLGSILPGFLRAAARPEFFSLSLRLTLHKLKTTIDISKLLVSQQPAVFFDPEMRDPAENAWDITSLVIIII